MLLFGSLARDDANADSDIDVLVVLKGQVNPGNAVTVEQATKQITHAEQFLQLAQNLIGSLLPNT